MLRVESFAGCIDVLLDRGLDDREQGVVELQVDLVVAGRDDCSVQGDVRGGGGVDVLTLP